MIRRFTVPAVLLALLGMLSMHAGAAPRTMVVTVDDLPFVSASVRPAAAITADTLRLLGHLAEHEVPAVGFVNESQLQSGGAVDNTRVDLLRLWLDAGFELGNHSYSHADLHRTPLAEFQQDILRGEQVLRPLLAERGREPRYFRHPYLHTGRDVPTQEALRGFLAGHGYRVAPVTVDNSEWIFARACDIALQRGDTALAQRIGDDYVTYMEQIVAYYEQQSQALLGREIPQVLLVHANRLNAAHLGRLLDRIENRGYRFGRLDDALRDEAYANPDEYTGPGGITWIHRWAITRGADPALFRGEPETPAYVLELTELPEHAWPAS